MIDAMKTFDAMGQLPVNSGRTKASYISIAMLED